MTALSGWENFYVIVGSATGALIGLQFVVMTLEWSNHYPIVTERVKLSCEVDETARKD